MPSTYVDIKKKEHYARKVCFSIGVFGLLLLIPFNWNMNLVYTGNKVSATVVNIDERWSEDKGPIIEVEYIRKNMETVNRKLHDHSGERFLFFIEKGDSLTLYESKNHPYKYYVPFINLTAKLSICVFFVLIPFVFMIFGRYEY